MQSKLKRNLLVSHLLFLFSIIFSVNSHASLINVVINEVVSTTTGNDVEYIELYGTPGDSLLGLSFLEVESDSVSANGMINFRFDFLAEHVIGANGFFLLSNEVANVTYGIIGNVLITNAFTQGSATFALVKTTSIIGTSIVGSEELVDSVGTTDGDYKNPGIFAPVIGPNGSFIPAGVNRTVDGLDTNTAADFIISSFNNDPLINTPTAGTALQSIPVPSPSTVSLLILGIVVLCKRHRLNA